MKINCIFLIFLFLLPAILASEDEGSAADDVINQRLSRAQGISIAVATAAIIVLFAVGKKKLTATKLFYAAAIAILLLIGYSYYYFTLTASAEEGIMVCESGQCFWAAHIHSQLRVEICGEEVDMGLEEGELAETHTHKERGQLHFHERLPVDPETKQVTDFSPLQLSVFFEGMGMQLTSECIGEWCNGDLCTGVPGRLSMTVNEVPSTSFGGYTWQDGDVIDITFSGDE
ncbi:hypothetical protein HY491_03720 [Candidatus Woesearchaeota archaeon]|nr:hypothetical protein [Candidatus Woesearchaeota archaeon]